MKKYFYNVLLLLKNIRNYGFLEVSKIIFYEILYTIRYGDLSSLSYDDNKSSTYENVKKKMYTTHHIYQHHFIFLK